MTADESSRDLLDVVHRLGEPQVVVVGDLMLDRYIWGNAERISQEAPVILLRADKREERLGGASSVAMLLQALGARVSLAGVVGADFHAEELRQLLRESQIDDQAVLIDAERPTTVKERYIGRAQHRHPQQMIRVDYETRGSLSSALEEQLYLAIDAQLDRADIVLVSDYDKGVCTPDFLARVFARAKDKNTRVLVDPMRGADYAKYRGASAITPNRLEAGLALGHPLTNLDEALQGAAKLRHLLELEASIVTLDKEGMALVHSDGRTEVYPTRPRQVYDITGAGDMVLAMLGLALASGADYSTAIRLANIAGGLEVEKIGVAPVTREELVHDLHSHPKTSSSRSEKCHELADLLAFVQARRRQGQRIAFTNGCFDLLHAGHVEYLREAKAQADVLVVGVNNDLSVRALKGATRPINNEQARCLVLAELESVDYLTLFGEATPMELIRAIRPDVLVKGADYRREDVVGGDFVESYGGRVYLARLVDGLSTTTLLERLRAA